MFSGFGLFLGPIRAAVDFGKAQLNVYAPDRSPGVYIEGLQKFNEENHFDAH